MVVDSRRSAAKSSDDAHRPSKSHRSAPPTTNLHASRRKIILSPTRRQKRVARQDCSFRRLERDSALPASLEPATRNLPAAIDALQPGTSSFHPNKTRAAQDRKGPRNIAVSSKELGSSGVARKKNPD
ncbi:hypothetical protein KM043_009168 [Ampulex compressa]|nr:hypothetical protein KM043_009168 [Ampulex compressa]